MKRIVLFAALTVVGFASKAQVNFGTQVGANVASYSEEYSNGSQTNTTTYDSKVGFTIGVVTETPIAASLFFRSELNFIQKGGKYKKTIDYGRILINEEASVATNYLEMPLYILYKFEVGRSNIFAGAGLLIGLGISGKYKLKSSTSSSTSEYKADIEFDGKANGPTNTIKHLKAADLGAGFIAGYQLNNRLVFKASYCLGLSNLSTDDNSKAKNKGFGFTIGYMFGEGNSTK